MRLTKDGIEALAKEVRKWAGTNHLGQDWSLFYNGKRFTHPLVKDAEGNYKYTHRTEKDVNPLNYCEWFDEKFIMGMSYDGIMYECINGYNRLKAYEKLELIAHDYGLYIEHCDSCHCLFAPNGDIEDYEYTWFAKEKPIYLYNPTDAPTNAIEDIMHYWHTESAKAGDHGGCVIGAYLEFWFNGNPYRMLPQSPWQGELSWLEPLDKVKQMLTEAGATEIIWNCGRLD